MKTYACLTQQIFSRDEYSVVPLRVDDKYDIMKWRNEQLYHLRQLHPLSKEDQNNYFSTVIDSLFEQQHPSQLLFSYLKEGKCIGYGGLVHINWNDAHGEVSFIMDTTLESKQFELHWSVFLDLIKEVAFSCLGFHKIFTYAFDVRPHLYQVLEKNQFAMEAVLKEHAKFNGEFINVLIHSCINGADNV